MLQHQIKQLRVGTDYLDTLCMEVHYTVFGCLIVVAITLKVYFSMCRFSILFCLQGFIYFWSYQSVWKGHLTISSCIFDNKLDSWIS